MRVDRPYQGRTGALGKALESFRAIAPLSALSFTDPGGTMNRREFLRTGGALAVAASGLERYAEAFAESRLRVGLIGAGWYGKADLFRLIQVAPVAGVSLCAVGRAMLADAAQQVVSRQVSKKT